MGASSGAQGVHAWGNWVQSQLVTSNLSIILDSGVFLDVANYYSGNI